MTEETIAAGPNERCVRALLENEMKVLIIESERGWGQKIDEVKEFATREEAEKFCREYNDKYNPPMDSAPDWYMYARMEDHERGESMLCSN